MATLSEIEKNRGQKSIFLNSTMVGYMAIVENELYISFENRLLHENLKDYSLNIVFF